MARRISTEEFIARARKIHGDKYDYSKVEYINCDTKICIICPIHGEFWQTPYNHLKGRGCPECGHIMSNENSRIWHKERCFEVAQKCKTYSEFQKRYSSAYKASRLNGWLNEMNFLVRTRPIKWTDDEIITIAKQFKTKKDFRNNYAGVYLAANRRGLLQTFDWLIDYSEYKGSYCIYCYICEENKTCYVGLTDNKERRFLQHKSKKKLSPNSKAFDLYKLTEQGFKYKLEIKYDNLTSQQAVKKEEQTVLDMQNKGYDILNIAKTGGLGRKDSCYNDYEACKHVALKCKTRREFKEKYYNAYKHSCINKWINDFTWLDYKVVKITYEEAENVAKRYKSKSDFRKNDKKFYMSAWRNGWLKNFTWLDKTIKMPSRKWTKELCEKEARKYNTKVDFFKYSRSAYYAALNNEWIDTYDWFISLRHKWTFEKLSEYSKQFKTKTEFRNKDNAAYVYAERHHFLNKFIWLQKRHILGRTYEDILKCAKQCKTVKEFRENFPNECNIAYKRQYMQNFYWLNLIKK